MKRTLFELTTTSLIPFLQTLAPFVLLIDQIWLCYAIFGILAGLASLATIFLIETLKQNLPETLDEMKSRSRKNNRVGVLDSNPKREKRKPDLPE